MSLQGWTGMDGMDGIIIMEWMGLEGWVRFSVKDVWNGFVEWDG